MENAFLLKNIFFILPLFVLSKSDLHTHETKDFQSVPNWPKYDHFGQISAVEVDKSGFVYVFHRGNRRWDGTSFSISNIFLDKDEGPIPEETIVILDQNDGSLLKKTGDHLFYLPHGLTVDDDKNVWVTDVALHQVFKFPPIDLKEGGGLKKAELTLGVRFEPGGDRAHFCKPTAVAVDKETKDFYVSDGYCNSRIIKYDKSGNILLTLGRRYVGSSPPDPYMLNLPHALAVAQDKQRLLVADREDMRVLSYDFQSGKFVKSYAEELKSRVFSVAYSPLEGGYLFALTNDDAVPKVVAVYNLETGKLVLSFSPKTNFANPHDLAVSHDGKYCFVVELDPYKIWKFKLDMKVISQISNETGKEHKKKVLKPSEEVDKLVPAESKIDRTSNFHGSSSYLAIALVVPIILISFLIFMFHYYRRNGGYRRYETRKLILDDDEGGIRLT